MNSLNRLRLFNSLTFMCFFIVNSAFAQSKDETIEWLTSKLTKPNVIQTMLGSGCSIVSHDLVDLNECNLRVQFQLKIATDLIICEYDIPISGINYESINGLVIPFDGIKEKWTRASGEVEIKYVRVSYFRFANSEPDLQSRILKALNHLSTFCYRKQEKF